MTVRAPHRPAIAVIALMLTVLICAMYLSLLAIRVNGLLADGAQRAYFPSLSVKSENVYDLPSAWTCAPGSGDVVPLHATPVTTPAIFPQPFGGVTFIVTLTGSTRVGVLLPTRIWAV